MHLGLTAALLSRLLYVDPPSQHSTCSTSFLTHSHMCELLQVHA